MPWWLIVIVIIILAVWVDSLLNSRKTQQSKNNDNPFHSIIHAAERKRQEELTRLKPADEQVAQRIKKLFYSASFHESRNVTAFHNILKELSQMRNEILLAGGTERMTTITNRVEHLCGNDMMGFQEYMAIFRYVQETTGTH